MSVAHSINYIHEIYFHQIAFKRLILMLLLNVQPSVKHHRFNRQIRSFIPFKQKAGKQAGRQFTIASVFVYYNGNSTLY